MLGILAAIPCDLKRLLPSMPPIGTVWSCLFTVIFVSKYVWLVILPQILLFIGGKDALWCHLDFISIRLGIHNWRDDLSVQAGSMDMADKVHAANVFRIAGRIAMFDKTKRCCIVNWLFLFYHIMDKFVIIAQSFYNCSYLTGTSFVRIDKWSWYSVV